MNNRIDELAIQAGAKIETAHWVYYDDFSYQKFAELIVHQMLDITDAHTEVFQTDRDRALIEHIKQSVKQHFGVEE
jgi:hypothetical protein